ncbi:hypothetical protein GCM10007888_32550 [Methylobacterium oxalidis]|uniref:Uncharacterized protein n=1 Tax=Methylobacterium oxalidis TaxID=944322 RepID=A0ABQ6DJ00_9HYPH|nr:hypothetical protein GCM10007888_32550 [Methylobacterium oxalidis]
MPRQALETLLGGELLTEAGKPAQTGFGEATRICEGGKREADQKLRFLMRHGAAARSAGCTSHRRHGLAQCRIAFQILKA